MSGGRSGSARGGRPRKAMAPEHPTVPPKLQAAIHAALRLAREAETVSDVWAGDKSVDGLRAALGAFGDAYDAWIRGGPREGDHGL
jgi:hypothetical protein